MANRSQEENEEIILSALRKAGDQGLNLDQVRVALLGENDKNNSLVKKMLERLKTKGCMRVKMGRDGLIYQIIPGR